MPLTNAMEPRLQTIAGPVPDTAVAIKHETITAADVQQTLKELQALNTDVIVPMHCAGERFI